MASNGSEFQISNSFPEPMRQFLMGSTDQRRDALVGKVEMLQRYFGTDENGRPKLQSIMNSPDLTSPPCKNIPESDAFKNEVKHLFREIVGLQIDMEANTLYGARAIDHELCIRPTKTSEPQAHAWVIGAKLDATREEGALCLSMGDALVGRLVERDRVGHVWSTSRTKQEAIHNHTHFNADLDNIQKHDFCWQMEQIDRQRNRSSTPLVVYFVFGNTGNNSEKNPTNGKTMNRSNIDSTIAFLDAAQEAGWLTDQTVRFVVVSSFHCSPARTNYNDKLPLPPSADAYTGEDTDKYKKVLQVAMQSAGLLEYTSSKFAQAALFAAALTTSGELRRQLEAYVEDIENLHRKLATCPVQEYGERSKWVLAECKEEIYRAQEYCNAFFEDTAGSNAIVRRADLVSRMAVVKIPFALTTMIATRAARVSVLTNVLSMNDTWARTKMRLGWAISPQTCAAWLEHAAMRMQSCLTSTTHGTIADTQEDAELGPPPMKVPRLLGSEVSRGSEEVSPKVPSGSKLARCFKGRSRECSIM